MPEQILAAPDKHLDYISLVTEDTMTRFRNEFLYEIERPDGTREVLWSLLIDCALRAREAGEPPEQFLVRLKRVMEATMIEHGGLTESTLQRLKQDAVTRAIKAYYMQ